MSAVANPSLRHEDLNQTSSTASGQPAYSAYVPCFNNAVTIRAAVESVFRQTAAPAEVVVVDDASTDGSMSGVISLPVRIIPHPVNLGRGAARARAMQEAQNDFVLCCDAANTLEPGFAARALTWFKDPRVAAVFGRISQPRSGNAVHRWRGRHLYKMDDAGWSSGAVMHHASLATYGAMVRRAAVLQVGNYSASRRHSEDIELGRRLLADGWDVIQDPRLGINAAAGNTLLQALERYWRWNMGEAERSTWGDYGRMIKYSAKLALGEFKAGDPAVAGITLLCPHYCFWRSMRRLSRRAPLSMP
jgi:glycosyltransferase involved in cell wall biosynthesis